jgi:hypothetical protein
MRFNLKGFLRFIGRWWSQILRRCGWSARRFGILLLFHVAYPLTEMGVWLGLRLDDLVYRGYRRVRIESPVFIVGNPRSGTTFLHRLMAKDERRFLVMEMWEILFAPSILGRKLVWWASALDRRLGGLLNRQVDTTERYWHKENVMHRVSLRLPEEDDYLLLHIWSALTAGLSSGLLEEARPYTYFDTALPPEERKRVMDFYELCLKRHLYAHPETAGRQYLAKNPSLCPKVGSILERFPDARIIYLVRNPLDMIPSYTSMMDFTWRVIGIPECSDGLHEYVLDMAQHWYHYPLQRLAQAPESNYIVVRYDDLVADPEQTVTEIYRRFGFEMSPEYRELLHQEAIRAESFKSQHHYSLEDEDLTRRQIVERCGDIIRRFGFDHAA